MTSKLLRNVLILLLLTGQAYAQDSKTSNVHIGFVYPLSTNGVRAGEYSNRFSVNLLVGVSGAEEGACLSGFSSIIKNTATGLVASGFSNHIFRGSRGVALAGFLNTIGKHSTGFEAAGFANVTGGLTGFQAAGFGNISAGNVHGMQAAGFVNTAGDVSTQAAGFVNVARDVKGVQVAGFINVARKVKGVQIAGFINIADSCEYPIGIINIVKNGEKSIGFSIDETLTTLVTFRSGGHKLYGILGAGYNFKSADPLFALEGGMGYHIPLSRYFRINTEATTLCLANFDEGTYFRSSVRALLSMRAGRNLELYLGPTFNYINYSDDMGNGIVEHYVWSTERYSSYSGLYVGAMAGVNICF